MGRVVRLFYLNDGSADFTSCHSPEQKYRSGTSTAINGMFCYGFFRCNLAGECSPLSPPPPLPLPPERKRTNYSLVCVCVQSQAFVIEFLGFADINSDLLQIIPTFMCLKVTVMMKWKWKKCKSLNNHSSTPSVVISACLTCLSFCYLHFRVTNAGLTEGVTRLQPSSDGKRIFETA